VAPQFAVEEVAPLAVLAPLQPPARVNRCVSFLMTMRYRPTRTSLCRSGCGNFSALGRRCSTTAVANKEAADKRATEEAMMKRATEERATEEATTKAAAVEEVAGKTVDEAAGAAGGSPAPRPGALSGRGQEGCGSKPLHPTSQMSLQGCLETSVCPAFSRLSFSVGLHSLITLFAQVLSLRCGHHDRHDCFCHRHRCRRCGCRGDSRAGS
jgi:hypothetical protein